MRGPERRGWREHGPRLFANVRPARSGRIQGVETGDERDGDERE